MGISTALLNVQNQAVLVVGDIMLDRWSFLSNLKTSPESGVPVLQRRESRSALGGAANAASVINELGFAKTILIGRIGRDLDGRLVKKLLRGRKVKFKELRGKSVPTTVKDRLIIDNQESLRIDRELKTPITRKQHRMITRLARKIPNLKAILISDYDKGVITEGLIKDLVRIGEERRVSVIADPAKDRLHIFKGVTILKPNAPSFQSFLEAEKRVEDLQARYVIVTLGENGCKLFSKGHWTYFSSHEVNSVIDVRGAGDAFAAGLMFAEVLGLSIEDAIKVARTVAAEQVSAIRDSSPDFKRIRSRLIQEYPRSHR